ncbi:MAG TPA: hypothetical protein VMO17_06970, partial [Terriglobia bacterium]|nr:hypothetical protein [Terriglobia bacterium]
PIVTVFAEHGTGLGIGAADWKGAVEVLGHSNLARGSYGHANGQGGVLQLTLSADSEQITEHGIPSQYGEFVRLLKRIDPKVKVGPAAKS